MSRLSQEMRVIPPGARAAAVFLGSLFVGFLFFYGVLEIDSDSALPLAAVLIAGFVFVSFSIFVLLVGYIYGDAKRRGMRPVLWLLLAIFIPNAIGILLYFILREPLLLNCPKCGAGAKPSFPFCPACGASLAETCPSCRSAIEPGWSHCARCGTELSPRVEPLR